MSLGGRGFGPPSDMRDDEDPFEWRTATIELASSRATTAECQIAQCNGSIIHNWEDSLFELNTTILLQHRKTHPRQQA